MTDLLEVDWSQLPKPRDDGGADHLIGVTLPDISLPATTGERVNLSALPGLMVVYAYPMTGTPGLALPQGWDMLPGARGCTPQACAFRDHESELRDLGVQHIFGVSTQPSIEQAEAAERLHLPFALLSDSNLEFCRALGLPTFALGERHLLKRITLVVRDSCVVEKFYPVFPPDEAPGQVVRWLSENEYG